MHCVHSKLWMQQIIEMNSLQKYYSWKKIRYFDVHSDMAPTTTCNFVSSKRWRCKLKYIVHHLWRHNQPKSWFVWAA